jgi:hypothetical protein
MVFKLMDSAASRWGLLNESYMESRKTPPEEIAIHNYCQYVVRELTRVFLANVIAKPVFVI